MKVTMRFEGGKELAAALAGLPNRVSRSIVKDVLMDVAEPMRARAASLAPRDPGAPDLADHIIVSATRRAQDLPTPTSQAVLMGPAKGFFYGHFVEYGTSRASAHPFMRPAFDAGADKALSEIGRRLWVELAAKGVSRTGTSSGGPLDDESTDAGFSRGSSGAGGKHQVSAPRGKRR